MTARPGTSRPFLQGLGVRLAIAFSVALLPLGIVSALQSRSLLEEARARSEAALLGETLLAVAPEANLIRSARVAASALAASMTVIAREPEACKLVMTRVIAAASSAYSFAAFVPASGDTVCTSSGERLYLTDSDRVKRQRLDPKPDVVVIRNAVASGTSVLAFGHPVFDLDGGYLGYVSISMPHSVLERKESAYSELGRGVRHEPIALITFDGAGQVLTSSNGLDLVGDALPVDRPLATLAKNGAWTFTAYSRLGVERLYAVFPLVENNVYAIGTWPNVDSAGPFNMMVSPYLMPALMWFASLLVAVLAAERLVTRHIRALRNSMTAFAAGDHRVAHLDIPDAATEIAEVTESYLKMTDTILHDEAELEDMIHQREVLLREVHHRVKNNLQLIASIMNMQMRQSHSEEAKSVMRGLQNRVMSLATIHRGLYQTSGLTDVRADELLADIVRQILKMATGPGRRFDVVTTFDDITLTPDQAVPLALLLTEALTNAVKYSGPAGDALPKLEVTLRREGLTDAVLSVGNDTGTVKITREKGTGLGSQLMTAFAQQLGGHSTVTTKGGVYRLRVRFAISAGQLGEAEQAADPQPAQ
jgi:two-component system, sensor histidine kinase PdtaS